MCSSRSSTSLECGMPDSDNHTVLIRYGNEQVPVSIEFRQRKNLSISVHSDSTVTALAPSGKSVAEIEERLQRKAKWISRQLQFFDGYRPHPEPKRFISGETHIYLGRQYRLKVRRSAERAVKLHGRYLEVLVPLPEDVSTVRRALDSWYRDHSEPIFRDRLERTLQSIPSLRGMTPKLRLRRMKGRWGSCSRAGAITLNTELIHTPLHCIEYVIAHEVCHLVVPDHSGAFFRLLSRTMPDWETRKSRLNRFVIR
ncbi:hypothetical protein BURK2_01554 [Burkholderiales bacterium]|nr:hypothetical protein BURK2_01554 [Burkholderiales bacterium]